MRELSINVGKEGRLKQRLSQTTAGGSWALRTEAINTLIDDLVRPTTDVARTIGAVAKEAISSQSMELEVDGRASTEGEFLLFKRQAARECDDRPVVGVHIGSDARRS